MQPIHHVESLPPTQLIPRDHRSSITLTHDCAGAIAVSFSQSPTSAYGTALQYSNISRSTTTVPYTGITYGISCGLFRHASCTHALCTVGEMQQLNRPRTASVRDQEVLHLQRKVAYAQNPLDYTRFPETSPYKTRKLRTCCNKLMLATSRCNGI